MFIRPSRETFVADPRFSYSCEDCTIDGVKYKMPFIIVVPAEQFHNTASIPDCFKPVPNVDNAYRLVFKEGVTGNVNSLNSAIDTLRCSEMVKAFYQNYLKTLQTFEQDQHKKEEPTRNIFSRLGL